MARLSWLVLVATLAAPVTAAADIFKIYGEANGGGMYGQGIAGPQKAESFFQRGRGGAYGVEVGAEALIFGGHIQHHGYINSDFKLTTWTQFMAGLNFGVDTGTPEDKKLHKGGYVAIGVNVGFGLGTGAQVDPPLNNAQVTDKGFMAEGRLGFGMHLNKVLDIGVVVPVSWGYLFKTGNGATANDPDTQYQSVQVDVLLVLRANARLL